ncbi:U6 snRNA-associated Sm-like protein LSm7 [Euphorbia peplus]|nr:U6 snRNA-associated Sm-like protein LSm7 [Euphorbia peplus]
MSFQDLGQRKHLRVRAVPIADLGHTLLSAFSNFSDKMSGRKETVLDLAKFVDKGVQVKLTGGRQVTGTLKGYDQLLNLVLDEAVEYLRDADDPLKTTDQTRQLGLIVCRGTAVMLVSPTDGTDEIANPFIQPDGA